MVAGAVVVPAPPAAPRNISLITAARDATGASLDDQPGGKWIHGFTYGPEAYTAGSVFDVCDMDTVDNPALGSPSGSSAAGSTTGGTLAAATYSYRVSAVRSTGETLAASAVTATTTGTTSKVTVTWQPVYGADHYNVYGRTGTLQKLGTVTGTSFVDTGSVTPSGALPAANTTGGAGDYSNPSVLTFQPYGIRASDRCSPFGFEARDYAGRALRQLQAVTPKQVEREFWTGSLAQAKGYPNRYLTDGNAVDVTTTAGTPMSRQGGFEALEQALADCGYGPTGMIHTQTRVTIPFGFARRAGNLLLTNNDTVVVPGVGYPGTGPDGTDAPDGATWIYATTSVAVRLDAPQLYPDPNADPDWRFQALDRNQNLITIRAARLAAATFDGPCQFACLISLDT